MLKNDILIPGNPWPVENIIEKKRLTRIRNNELLFHNKLQKVNPQWYQRVSKEWPTGCPALVAANLYKTLTLLCADLLYGEQGDLLGASCVDKNANKAVKDIITSNRFNLTAYEVGGIGASMRGDGLYSISASLNNKNEMQVEIAPQPANYWFPVVNQDNVKKIKQHILAWPILYGNKAYLRKQIHEKGIVYNYAYDLSNYTYEFNDYGLEQNNIIQDSKGQSGKIGQLVKLESIGITDIEEVTDTKIDNFLIVHCPNWGMDNTIHGVDDYEDLDNLIYELAIILSRNSMVLAKHTDPNMYGPASNLHYNEVTGQWDVKTGGAFYPVEGDENPPGYLTWDGQLEAAEKQIDRIIQLILMTSETSQAVFNLDKMGSQISGSALKKLMMRTLAKVNRKKMYADPAIKDVLEIAQQMDVEWCGGGYEPERPSIQWQDGLPDDDVEETNIVNSRVEAGTMSKLEGIMRLDKCSEEEAKKKLERIQEEQDAALPAFGRADVKGQVKGEPAIPNDPFNKQGADNN